MFFCPKPRKPRMSLVCNPVVCVLALAGALSVFFVVRTRGKTAKRALSKAGCQCGKAIEDAAEEIINGEGE